jgi:TonB family protein
MLSLKMKTVSITMAIMLNPGRNYTISLAITLLASFCWASGSFADTFKLGTQEAETFKQAEVLAAPEPVISSELKEECLKAFCVARFNIDAKGRIIVQLVTSSGSPEVDEITVSTLRNWRFRPALRGTEPVPSTRKIRVEFVVE